MPLGAQNQPKSLLYAALAVNNTSARVMHPGRPEAAVPEATPVRTTISMPKTKGSRQSGYNERPARHASSVNPAEEPHSGSQPPRVPNPKPRLASKKPAKAQPIARFPRDNNNPGTGKPGGVSTEAPKDEREIGVWYKEWGAYMRFGQLAHRWRGAPREEVLKFYQRSLDLGMTCFWRAVILASHESQTSKVWDLALSSDYRGGVTEVQAVSILDQLQSRLGVYNLQVGERASLGCVRRSRLGCSFGVILLPLTSEYKWEPHWVPFCGLKDGASAYMHPEGREAFEKGLLALLATPGPSTGSAASPPFSSLPSSSSSLPQPSPPPTVTTLFPPSPPQALDSPSSSEDEDDAPIGAEDPAEAEASADEAAPTAEELLLDYIAQGTGPCMSENCIILTELAKFEQPLAAFTPPHPCTSTPPPELSLRGEVWAFAGCDTPVGALSDPLPFSWEMIGPKLHRYVTAVAEKERLSSMEEQARDDLVRDEEHAWPGLCHFLRVKLPIERAELASEEARAREKIEDDEFVGFLAITTAKEKFDGELEHAESRGAKTVQRGFVRAYGPNLPPVSNSQAFTANWFGAKEQRLAQRVVPYDMPWWAEVRAWAVAGANLVQARRDMIGSGYVRAYDFLYSVVDEVSYEEPMLYVNGDFQLRCLEYITTNDGVYMVGAPQRYAAHGKQYELAEVTLVNPKPGVIKGAVKKLKALFGFTTRTPIRNFCTIEPEKHLEWVKGPVASHEARLRLEWDNEIRYFETTGRPECVVQAREMRAHHLAMDDPSVVSVRQLAKTIRDADEKFRSLHQPQAKIVGFSTPSRPSYKACVSCNTMPVGKYRWKHRICHNCARLLRIGGHVTPSGRYVQEGAEVPTCYPGLVYIKGREAPADAKKWAQVVVEGEPHPVQCNPLALFGRHEYGARSKAKRWVDVEKADLEKLRGLGPSKYTHALAGIACSGAVPMMSAKGPYNQLKALLGRIYRQPKPKPWGNGPHPEAWQHASTLVRELLPERLEKPPMEFSEWLASMPSRRRKALLAAGLRLQRLGLRPSMARFTAFVKQELLPGFAKSGGRLSDLTGMIDRLIQGPADETHCVAGPILKPYIESLKKQWSVNNAIFYGSAGPEALHAFLQRLCDGPGVYFWCDFSMFDNTHSADSWAFMEALYGNQERDFRQVLEMWRAPRGTIGPFRYQAPVMNASGRDDTALANAVLNGFATYMSATAAILKKPVLEVSTQDIKLARASGLLLSVCGDDSLGKIPLRTREEEEDFIRRMNENIAHFGFEAKLETSRRLADAVYLGQRPYPTRSGWFWGKTIGRACYKMGWVTDPNSRDVMAHITGLAHMHLKCSSHVPVLSDMARRIADLREGAKRTEPRHDPNRPWEWTLPTGAGYDEVTLQAVAEVYGCTVSDVQGLCKQISELERIPAVIDHWLLKLMICKDDL